jgi:hypothetical protein
MPTRALSSAAERQLLVARDDHRAWDRRQIARLPALLVVLHELVYLPPDDLALIRLLARGDAALQQVPVHLGGGAATLPAADRRFGLLPVTQHFEPDEFVDVTGGQ